MQPLAAVMQPLAMQHGIDILGQYISNAVARLPKAAETIGVVAVSVGGT